MTSKILYFNYYRDSDPKRRKELDYCVNQNLNLKYIDRYVIFIDDESLKQYLPPDDRIEFVMVENRMDFSHCVNYAKDIDAINIIINLDIYLEDSDVWLELDNFFDGNHALVLTRHNLTSKTKYYREEPHWTNGNFCDAYLFKTPTNNNFINEDFNFTVGTPQCDNLMMYLMTKYWHTYSWGSKYKIYHYDVYRKPKSTQVIITDKTDFRASLRKSEHINIPAHQDWSRLFDSGEQPHIRPTWLKHRPKYLKPQ
jgi:hypothetical protein